MRVNTNLGINLLLAPLAKAAVVSRQHDSTNAENEGRLSTDAGTVVSVLEALTPQDSQDVYAAIQLASPGGIDGATSRANETADGSKYDVHGEAPDSLLAAMQQAAAWDRIAWQYANGFSDLFERIVPWLCGGEHSSFSLNERIVAAHVRMMSECPDSLIARKCGLDVATEASDRAAAVVAHEIGTEDYHRAIADLDFWLRSDGHRRNPGTTADLIAAGLFVALVDGHLLPPYH